MRDVTLLAFVGRRGQLTNHDGIALIDVQRFMDVTPGATLIVGYRTYKRYLEKKNLGDRLVAVWTNNQRAEKMIEAYAGIDDARPLFVVGGEATYREFLPLCSAFQIHKALDQGGVWYDGESTHFLPPPLASWTYTTSYLPFAKR